MLTVVYMDTQYLRHRLSLLTTVAVVQTIDAINHSVDSQQCTLACHT